MISITNRLNPKDYEIRVYEKHNGNIVLLSKYTKSTNKLLAMCVKCGYKFEIFPQNLLVKSEPCDFCAGRIEEFNRRMQIEREMITDKYKKFYEIKDIWENKKPGIYFLFNQDKVLCNIGSTVAIRSRVLQHKKENKTYTYANYILIEDSDERYDAEKKLINIFKPTDNYWDVFTYNLEKFPKSKYRSENLELHRNKLIDEVTVEKSGLYFIFDSNNTKLLYIGKAKNIREEIREYCKVNQINNDSKEIYYSNYIIMSNNEEIENAKNLLVAFFKPVNS